MRLLRRACRAAGASANRCVTRVVGRAATARAMLREVAVSSRSTIPTGIRSIMPSPKIVFMNTAQKSGSTMQTPK